MGEKHTGHVWRERRECTPRGACPLMCHLNFKILAMKNHFCNSHWKALFLKSLYWRGSIPFWHRIPAPPLTIDSSRKGTKYSQCIMKAREAREAHVVWDKASRTDNRERKSKVQKCIQEWTKLGISNKQTHTLLVEVRFLMFPDFQIVNWTQQNYFLAFQALLPRWTEELHSYRDHTEEKFFKATSQPQIITLKWREVRLSLASRLELVLILSLVHKGNYHLQLKKKQLTDWPVLQRKRELIKRLLITL